MNKKIIITIGLPRSGKTTWSQKQNLPIVNRDSIRLALYNQPYIQEMEDFVTYFEEKMVNSLFEAGHDTIIIDATHMKWQYISKWEDKYEIELKYFYVSVDVCKERALQTRKEYLIPIIDKMINETDIYSMQKYYQ